MAYYVDQLHKEKLRGDELLSTIFPARIAERLKKGETCIVDSIPEASVLFADIVNFSRMTAQMPAYDVMSMLNILFGEFDILAKKHGVEKIKTIGVSAQPVKLCSNVTRMHTWLDRTLLKR